MTEPSPSPGLAARLAEAGFDGHHAQRAARYAVRRRPIRSADRAIPVPSRSPLAPRPGPLR